MNKHQPARIVQLRDAKASLSAIVAAAEHGQETVITRHGKPVARVVAERPNDAEKRVNKPNSPYHGMTFLEMLMAIPEDIDLIRDPSPPRTVEF